MYVIMTYNFKYNYWKIFEKKYKFIPDHFKPNLPKSIELGDVAGISIDQQDNIYLFNRSKHPVIVLSQTGELLRTWGQGVFRIHMVLILDLIIIFISQTMVIIL